MNALTVLIVVVGVSISHVTCQSSAAQLLAQNPCSSKTTCSECIRTASCSWCYAADFNRPRCFNPAMEGGTAGCDEAYIYNPDNLLSMDVDKEFNKGAGSYSGSGSADSSRSGAAFVGSGAKGAGGDDLIQIRPQRVRLELRMNQVQELHVSYSQAQDYPVDLYYLMDLSRSMKDDQDKLSTLGNLLSSTMRNITSNFRLGFGSFVDKVVMPYVSTIPKNLISPCPGCAAPYGYINAMPLSTDTEYFNEAVSRANLSGNLDGPEGGFDAIMQAIVCKADIGWRDQARRLLVLSTDAGFHYAGDGKLGGIIQPNDGQCHLDRKGVYTHSTIQDYPSISQINLKVRKHAINLIFAVSHDEISVYEQLSTHIEGSSSGVLSDDSSNVVDLVKDQYNKITSAVEMKDNSSNAIQIEYYSRCLGSGKAIKTNKCDGLKVGDVVEFTAEITLKECPNDPSEWKQYFQIYPVGISENLIVEVDMLCDCPCEHPGSHAFKDDGIVCSGYGVMACGICHCNPGYFGKNCQCSPAGGVSIEQEQGCRPQNSTLGPLCSNRGKCNCGQCDCDKMDDVTKVISGPYCECDNFTCDMNKGLMCSGSDHGQCMCGKCKCNDNYSGSACQCLKDQAPCISPENGLVCSGNGQCVCGHCVCNVGGSRQFSGRYCDKCPTCPGRCAEFKDCVLCEVHKRGELYSSEPGQLECGNCTLEPIIEEGKIEANESRNEHLCSFYDDENCLYVYVYSYNETHQLHIRAQKERECPPKVFILGIVLGVIAAIVLIGLALLMLWKMVTTIHDRREFARFEKERMMAKWDTGENPIYKQATSTFKNPTYAGK